MAIAGEHAKIGAEIFVNCLRLSGRFDYENCHGSEAETLCFCLSSKVDYRRQWSPTLPPARYELTSLSLFVNRADSGIRQNFCDRCLSIMAGKVDEISAEVPDSPRYFQVEECGFDGCRGANGASYDFVDECRRRTPLVDNNIMNLRCIFYIHRLTFGEILVIYMNKHRGWNRCWVRLSDCFQDLR